MFFVISRYTVCLFISMNRMTISTEVGCWTQLGISEYLYLSCLMYSVFVPFLKIGLNLCWVASAFLFNMRCVHLIFLFSRRKVLGFHLLHLRVKACMYFRQSPLPSRTLTYMYTTAHSRKPIAHVGWKLCPLYWTDGLGDFFKSVCTTIGRRRSWSNLTWTEWTMQLMPKPFSVV